MDVSGIKVVMGTIWAEIQFGVSSASWTRAHGQEQTYWDMWLTMSQSECQDVATTAVWYLEGSRLIFGGLTVATAVYDTMSLL